MQGTADKPGIVPQALEHLFRQLPSAAGPSSGGANGGCGSGSVRVLVSAYEVGSLESLPTAKCCCCRFALCTGVCHDLCRRLTQAWPSSHHTTATQIYNEVVYDLLALASTTAGPACAAASAARPALRLKEAQGHITVVGAVEVGVAGARSCAAGPTVPQRAPAISL